MHNLAAIHEAIARVLPERECIVFRDRRFSWAQTTERTRRLGCVLRAHGLGCFRERRELRGHESGQDAVALYLYNGNEYLEGMLGAFKARCAPINVNYRYVEDELVHLFADSRAAAVVYHAAFAARLERIRSKLAAVKLWLQVDDGSGTPLLPGAIDYEAALASAAPDPPRDLSPDDLYVLYTGGTTGKPKGVLWRQQDIFLGALYPPGAPPDADGVAARALERGDAMRVLPAPPFMHGAAHWAAFNIAFLGGTVVIPSHPERLDAHDIWSTVERERATALTIVGDAFARPLLDALAERSYDLSSLRLLTSGGAILSRERKRELVSAIPGLRINDSLGSSESGMQAVQTTVEGSEVATGSFDLARSNVVLSAAMDRVLAPGDDEIGWLAKSGHVPLGYLGDEAKTARTFPTIDGVRYPAPAARARCGDDQQRRREDLRRGGRARAEAAPRHPRRARDRNAARALRAAGDGARRAARGGFARRARLARHRRGAPRRLQAAARVRRRARDRALAERQARLRLGARGGGAPARDQGRALELRQEGADARRVRADVAAPVARLRAHVDDRAALVRAHAHDDVVDEAEDRGRVARFELARHLVRARDVPAERVCGDRCAVERIVRRDVDHVRVEVGVARAHLRDEVGGVGHVAAAARGVAREGRRVVEVGRDVVDRGQPAPGRSRERDHA